MKASLKKITKKEKAPYFTRMEEYLQGILILNKIFRIKKCIQKYLDKGSWKTKMVKLSEKELGSMMFSKIDMLISIFKRKL